MAHNYIATDSPLSRRIVRAFLHFLNSVEPGPGVDAEGIEVARECLAEAFKLNQSPVAGDDVKSDSLIDIFKSLEAKKQCEPSKSDVGPQPDSVDASSSFSGENPARGKNHSEASKSTDEDSTQGPHAFVSKDELCGQFFAALEKNCYFRSNTDGSDDPVQLEKASCLFNEACMELERSGCHQFSLKNLAESLKTLGNKAMQSKKYSDAIELYNCAIAVHEKSAVYYCNRAAAYTQINKYTEAIQDCLRSIEIDPNYSKAYSRLGLVYYAQGNYRDAIHKGFRKALQLDPNNESVKENIRVAERKLLEEQHRAYQNQNSRSSQEFPNQSAQGGSRSHSVPPPFSSMSFNPRDIASMFMNITNPTNAQPQGSHSHQERQEDSNGSGTSEPEIRIGGNISVNMEDMPEDITGALQSMMEMLSGAAPPGQPQDQTNGRTAPN
ncbi:Small glutamine-rich tetratricopeptide repeat-containing protein alpha [Glycine soja]|nr:Small glutamine-rich tetratricopeptide repeat-containing protein alpha [Glycine soja]